MYFLISIFTNIPLILFFINCFNKVHRSLPTGAGCLITDWPKSSCKREKSLSMETEKKKIMQEQMTIKIPKDHAPKAGITDAQGLVDDAGKRTLPDVDAGKFLFPHHSVLFFRQG